MKTALAFLLFLFVSASYGQMKPCNQLPYAQPDVKANYELALIDSVQTKLPERLDMGPAQVGTFKAQITCEGSVKYFNFENGDLSQDQQKVIIAEASKMTWVPAVKDGIAVTTNVFIEFSIENNKVSIQIL